MKIIRYLSLVLVAILTFSCEKHEIQYPADLATGMAEIQIYYYNPVTTATTNNIYRVELNDQLVANRKAPLNTYNAIPNGSVGRFFTVTPGTVNIKLYQGSDDAALTKVYDQDASITEGKQEVFIHDFNTPPVVFDNGFPYVRNVTSSTDSTAYVKFYNFLYETAGVPTTLKIQYQYQDWWTKQPVNIGPPVSFGQSTGWQKVIVVKDNNISQGSRTMTFYQKVVDANGNITGTLQIRGTSGTYADYAGTQSMGIGRWYHHTMAGLRAATTATASVRVFTAL